MCVFEQKLVAFIFYFLFLIRKAELYLKWAVWEIQVSKDGDQGEKKPMAKEGSIKQRTIEVISGELKVVWRSTKLVAFMIFPLCRILTLYSKAFYYFI